MAPGQDTQLEKVIDEVLKSGDAQALDIFLQRDVCEGLPIKCSLQFLTKLDKLVSRSLDQKDSKSASLGLATLYKYGKHLKLPGGCQGLSGIIAQGLLKKWFEKCRQLWIQCGSQWDETLFNLCEDFFDALMVVHEACKEGTYIITESFLYPVGQLAVDPRICILIQKEAIRIFNLILDKIPVELKKERKILTSQDASDIMIKLAGQILKGGDYDLQTALMEALCRMATPVQRRELADRWFSMEHVACAFVKIRDSEFETDCRKFLNLVNGMQGDRRRVYSYPCLEVYLDKHELLMPADEKLEEFWIDFNLDSHRISFYFSLPDEEAQGQWETICISENEVQSYTVKDEGKRKVLQLKLSEVVVVGAVEGSSLTIHFSSSLDILQAAQTVYGHGKNQGFVGKTGTSVVKTTVQIIMEDNSSQVVPESQMSLGEIEKNTVPHLLPAPSAPVQMVTPTKMRISESTTFISNSAGGSVHGARSISAVMSSNTSTKGKGKPSLEMVRSSDRQGEFYLGELRTTAKTCSNGTTPNSTIAGGMTEQSAASLQSTASKPSNKNKVGKHKKNIPVAKAVDVVQTGQEELFMEPSFVPDTQPRTGRNISFNWNKLSVSEMLTMATQKINSPPRPEPCSSVAQTQERLSSTQKGSVPGSSSSSIAQRQLHTELTQRLQQVLSERNQNPAPQEPSAPQIKMSDIRENSKGRNSADRCASILCTPKEQQAQGNGLAKGKSKRQMSLEVDAAPITAPAKASTTKALQKRAPPHKVETNRALSSKNKRDSEVAGSMVKLISSHYEINTRSTAKDTDEMIPKSWIPPLFNFSRNNFNMSWLSGSKKEASGGVSLVKSYSKNTTNSTRQRKDVFAFNVDVPLSVGGKNETFTNTSAISSSDIHDSSALLSTTKKGQPVAKEKRHVKKHLFSDTDYTPTDISWLRESSRKPKPKVTTYSRQAPIKPKAVSPHASYVSPDAPPPSIKPIKGNTKSKKKKPDVKESVEKPIKTVKPSAAPSRPGRRPRRTAATSKSYREPDTDDSQSESEKPPVPKENAEKTHKAAQVTKKKTASKQATKSYMKLESSQSESESVTEQPPTSKNYLLGQQGKREKINLEVPEVKKRKSTSSQKSTDTYRRLNSNNQPGLKKPSGLKQQRPENVLPETSRKFNKKNVVPAQEKTNGLMDSWAARLTSFCPSPPLIETMRSAERSAPTLGLTCSPLLTPRGSPLPASPDPPYKDTPSPVLLLPRSTVSSKGNFRPSSFYSAEKKRNSSKTGSVQSGPSLPSLTPIRKTPAPHAPTGPSATEISPIQQHLPSAPPSTLPLSTQPLLTSTLLELDKPSLPSPPQSPFPEDAVNHGSHYGFSKVSSVSWVSLSQSSTKSSVFSSRIKDSPAAALAVSNKTEKTPSSDGDLKSEQLFISGPSRKRHVSSSSSEEDEKEERKKSKMRVQRSPRMKPRKLFKSSTKHHGEAQSWGEQSSLEDEESKPKDRTFKVTKERITEEYQNIKNKTVRDTTHGTVAEVSADGDVSHVTSSSHTMSSSHWDAEVADIDMDMDFELPKMTVNPSNLCQKFSTELKKKFQNRHNMVEVYNKQTLKTVQHHVSSLNIQVNKYRSQRLEQVQKVLLDEIHKLEQDDSVLKSMEKDLTMYWKKQTVAFHSYQEQQSLRNEALKKAVQSNVCHSLEYEERIFTSQMCLIRKDMKSVQDRLLSEMQDGEIKSVKRGLHALFFP